MENNAIKQGLHNEMGQNKDFIEGLAHERRGEIAKAKAAYKKGAEAQDPQSMYRLAKLYARKLDLRNYSSIRLRLEEINPLIGIIASAVEQDLREMRGDGYMRVFLEEVITGKKSLPSKASVIIALLKTAARKEYLPAAHILGEIYEALGHRETACSFYGKAAALFAKCSEHDDEVALCLAKMYHDGKEMQSCYDKALRYAEKAKAMGNPEAEQLVKQWQDERERNRDLLSEALDL